ncbi:MAG: hypothetical protein AABW84_02255 [Nanoarchaeota archaeon]
MNNRGDTPVWTIIVFGIIAIVVLVLAIIMLSGSSTAGGNKITDLFGVISIPKIIQAEQGDSIKDASCTKSSDCISKNLACVNNKCTTATSQDLVIDGVDNCANNNADYSNLRGMNRGGPWCIAAPEGFIYQVEYNNGKITDDKGDKSAKNIHRIVMLDITTANIRVPTTPELFTGMGPDDYDTKAKPTWLPPNSIHTFEGGLDTYVCGWYSDNKCSNNDEAVLVRVYQLEKGQQGTDSGAQDLAGGAGAGTGAEQGADSGAQQDSDADKGQSSDAGEESETALGKEPLQETMMLSKRVINQYSITLDFGKDYKVTKIDWEAIPGGTLCGANIYLIGYNSQNTEYYFIGESGRVNAHQITKETALRSDPITIRKLTAEPIPDSVWWTSDCTNMDYLKATITYTKD